MSLANKISLFRILLAPCLVASLVYYHPSRDWLRYVTLALFVIGILTDALDGFIARSKHQQSQLGAVLDPVADKFLILSTLVSLSMIHGLPDWMRVPAWFNLIVFSRDAILLAGIALIFASTGALSIRPSRLGKATIVAQMLVIPVVLLQWPLKTEALTLAAVLSVLSGIGYLRTGVRLLS